MEQEQQAVCKQLGRKFIGIDNNPIYMHAAKKRIMKVDPIDTSNIEGVPDHSLLKKFLFINF